MFKLAHLSDLHLGPLPRVRPRDLLGKRFWGYLSWLRARRRHHTPLALAKVIADTVEQGVDHIAITGDLVNIALPSEFAAAAEWLKRLGPPERVTVIPGNHDAYVAGGLPGWPSWASYMGATGPTGLATVPFVKEVGPLVLVGLSTAVPTPAGYASGHLGSDQLTALDRVLAELEGAGRPRIVMLHHPPVQNWSPARKALHDAAAFRAVIARHGAELVLCGHEHRLIIGALDGPQGEVPVFCAPSASLGAWAGRRVGGYIVYSFAIAGRTLEIGAEYRAAGSDGLVTTRVRSTIRQSGTARDGRLLRVA